MVRALFAQVGLDFVACAVAGGTGEIPLAEQFWRVRVSLLTEPLTGGALDLADGCGNGVGGPQ